jgi:hypothetical protein
MSQVFVLHHIRQTLSSSGIFESRQSLNPANPALTSLSRPSFNPANPGSRSDIFESRQSLNPENPDSRFS